MFALLSLIGHFIETASAQNVIGVLGDAGLRGEPSVQSMWTQICATLPFCSIGEAAPEFIATKIINVVFSLLTIAGVIVLIYAGIKMITGQGSEEDLTNAKTMGLYAAGGIILALIARPVILYVANVLVPALLGA